jgi:hypothetical protein
MRGSHHPFHASTRRLAAGCICVLSMGCSGTAPAPRPTLLQASMTQGPAIRSPSPIVELRQYTLHPGRRDELMTMFDANFVDPQEAAGISVIGQFRDLDDAHKFVWLRGFPTMEARAQSLGAFYGGPVWQAWRNAANATIIDNDNVLLLRPTHAGAGFTFDADEPSGTGVGDAGQGIVIATIYHLDPTDEKERDFVRFFNDSVAPVLAEAGAPVVAAFVTERSANTFPRLPVREGEHVFVWFARFPSTRAYDRFRTALAASPRWRDSVGVELSSRVREPYVLRLSPTRRSRLHG